MLGRLFESLKDEKSKDRIKSKSSNENENRESTKHEKIGLFVLFEPPHGVHANIDIVAVHGLLDDPFHAWEGGGRNWLCDEGFLPHLIPSARIMTYGYNSTVALSQSIAGIDQFAETLLNLLEQERRSPNEKVRPLIFICHSLGGIVVKKALVVAHNRSPKYYRDLLDNIKGIAFLGVPHRGSAIARFGYFLAKILSNSYAGRKTNKDLVKILKKDSKILNNLSREANHLLNNLIIYSFYETERLWGHVIVTEESARLNIPNEKTFAVNANHSSICKFPSDQGQTYRFVGRAITELAETVTCQLDRSQDSKSEDGMLFRNDELNDKEQACMKSIFLSDYGAARRRCPSPVPQTCKWILEKPEFCRWRSGCGPNVLWISGRAGSGKTMLSSFLIDQLQMFFPIVCYFFLDNKIISQNTASSLLRGILHQLLQANRQLIRNAMRFFETRGKAMVEEISSLWDIIESCFDDPKLGNSVFVLDALDECEPTECHQVLHWMMEFFRTSQKKNIQILITSRPNTAIQDILDSRSDQLILGSSATAKQLESDIRLVVEYEIHHMPALKSWPDNRKKQLRARLIENADKTFLWVSLVLHMLPHQADASEDRFHRILTEMPDGLDDVYSKMLDAIPESDRYAARQMLEILVVAREPMSLMQLNECWAIQSCHRSLSDLPYQPDMTRTISRLCGNFVHILEGRCYLVHQSAKDYLLTKTSLYDPPWFGLTLAKANLSLAKRCVSFLNLDDFSCSNLLQHPLTGKVISLEDRHKIPQPHLVRQRLKNQLEPFLHYAIHHWAFHFRESKNYEVHDLVAKAGFHLLEDVVHRSYYMNKSLRAYWFAKMLRLSDILVEGDGLDHEVPPTVFCAYNGHNSILPHLLNSIHIDTRIAELEFTALHAAVLGKQLDTISLLVKRGADVNAIDKWGRTPLHLAARLTNVAILCLLLRSGANPKIEDHYGITPLHDAQECGFEIHIDLLSGYHSDQVLSRKLEVCLSQEPNNSNPAPPPDVWVLHQIAIGGLAYPRRSSPILDSRSSSPILDPRSSSPISDSRRSSAILNPRSFSPTSDPQRSSSIFESDSDSSSERRSASIASRNSSASIASRNGSSGSIPRIRRLRRTSSLPDQALLRNRDDLLRAVQRKASAEMSSTKIAHRTTSSQPYPSTPTLSSRTPTNASGSSSNITFNRNNQADPHKCERMNPSTGKSCNTQFSRSYDLARHEDTIHSSRKMKIRCQSCTEEKTFSKIDAFIRHMQVVHPFVSREIGWEII